MAYKTACGGGFPLNIPEGDGGSGGPTTAENVSYDNTTSQLTAENVQAAIDEMVENFGDGVDSVYNACVAAGSTPSSKSPADIATAIGNITTTGTITKLYTGPGSLRDPNISEAYTISEDGYIIATGYGYLNSAELKVNSGSNQITNTEGYYFTMNNDPVAVSENDVVSFAAVGSGSSAVYFNIYLITGVTIPTTTRKRGKK